MQPQPPPLFVGIAGGSASGKTTIARALADRLGARCVLVAHDRYYHPKPTVPDPAPRNFDHPDALDTEHLVRDLRRLREGATVHLPVYDFATHDRLPPAHWEAVEPRPVIVVEGILVLADPRLRDELDFRIYVDAPDDLRLVRRVRRDLSDRGRAVLDVLDQYERTVRPMFGEFVLPSRDHADLVVDGTCDPEAVVDALLDHLAVHR
jgi:uridine kinase